jgi:tetraacyldisaccharide 4''-kinase
VLDLRRSLVGIWTGAGLASRAARAALTPFSALYRAAAAGRGLLYDRRILPTYQSSVPVISVGNLTVGGTGKTPISAWLATEILERGRAPAVVLRGYGEDEPLVHKRLNPSAEVVVCRDKVRGVREAIACGADVVVLDDAFQHRRAARDLDILLLSADGWTGDARLLPAGPWREPLKAARRSSLIIITRKTAPDEKIDALRRAISAAAPSVPQAVAALRLGDLYSTTTGHSMPVSALSGSSVLAIAAVANPESFYEQLRGAGANVNPRAFPDHHNFSAREAAALAKDAEAVDFAVCTLKDAVKLEALWPAEGGSLWYVSQRVTIEEGRTQLEDLLDRVTS